MTPERRHDLRIALGHSLDRWLASVAAESGAEHLVLADSNGLLVAGPASAEAERIAAQSCAEPGAVWSAPVNVQTVSFGDEALHLCAVGDPARRVAALQLAEPGLRRILAGHLPA